MLITIPYAQIHNIVIRYRKIAKKNYTFPYKTSYIVFYRRLRHISAKKTFPSSPQPVFNTYLASQSSIPQTFLRMVKVQLDRSQCLVMPNFFLLRILTMQGQNRLESKANFNQGLFLGILKPLKGIKWQFRGFLVSF